VVYRKTFEVETTGSRKSRNLRPKISDDLPQGFNYRVHSYDEVNGTCVVEVWCSDHEILPPHHRKNAADLAKFGTHQHIKKVVPSPKQNEVIGCISISDLVENIGKPEKRIENVDRECKKLKVKGLEMAFLRSHKSRDTIGREIEEFVLDEG